MSLLQPRTPTIATIEEVIVSWMSQEPDLFTTFELNGGWEPWAQVQLAKFLAKSTTTGTIEREPLLYLTGTRLKADFLITSPGRTNVGVELKCRRKNEKKAQFQERVLEDIQKMNNGIRPGYRPCLMYSLAITNSPADLGD
jgi:hypothetical protein